MTRESAKQNLINMGISEPTEEQITKYLDSITEETKGYKSKLEDSKADKDKIAELEKQLDAINKQNMTDLEKANAEKQEAQNDVDKLKKQVALMQTKQKLAELGIVGEEADNLISGDGGISFDVLGQIISAREKASATAKEKELAGQATNPGGGKGKDDVPEKTQAEQIAESLGKAAAASSKDSEAIIASYKS